MTPPRPLSGGDEFPPCSISPAGSKFDVFVRLIFYKCKSTGGASDTSLPSATRPPRPPQGVSHFRNRRTTADRSMSPYEGDWETVAYRNFASADYRLAENCSQSRATCFLEWGLTAPKPPSRRRRQSLNFKPKATPCVISTPYSFCAF